MKISILGAGAWGIVLSKLLFENGHEILVWSNSKENIDFINKNHFHKKLENIKIPEEIKFTNDISDINSEIIISAIASPYVRETIKKLNIKDETIIVSVTKGIEEGTLFTMSKIIKDVKENAEVVALSGPTLAIEVANHLPTACVAASANEKAALLIQNIFSNEYFRVYTNDDIEGTEFCGAMKNIIALSCGMVMGLGFGNNTIGALLTRGLAEMVRLGEKLGYKKETFYGLAGIGDLITTATSTNSRNNLCGTYLAKGLSKEEAIKKVGMTVESINTLPAILKLKDKYNIEMPISEMIYKILEKEITPLDAITKLMLRDKKKENL